MAASLRGRDGPPVSDEYRHHRRKPDDESEIAEPHAGKIEENFVVNLTLATPSCSADRPLTFEVSAIPPSWFEIKEGEAQIPSYGGGRLPLRQPVLAVRS